MIDDMNREEAYLVNNSFTLLGYELAYTMRDASVLQDAMGDLTRAMQTLGARLTLYAESLAYLIRHFEGELTVPGRIVYWAIVWVNPTIPRLDLLGWLEQFPYAFKGDFKELP